MIFCSGRLAGLVHENADRVNFIPPKCEIHFETIGKSTETLAYFISDTRVSDAKTKATADLIPENGKHEDYVWQKFLVEMGRDPL